MADDDGDDSDNSASDASDDDADDKRLARLNAVLQFETYNVDKFSAPPFRVSSPYNWSSSHRF